MTKKRGKTKFNARDYSSILINEYDFFCDKNEILWIYSRNTGLWIIDAEKIVKKILREDYLDNDHISINCVNEVISDLRSLSLRNMEFPKSHWTLIPFNNGAYDLVGKQFSEFKPDHNFISKMAVNYNADIQDCPFIDRIFREIVVPEKVSDLYELAAYCLVNTYANQEIYFLVGAGRNGKSIYTHILTRLIGKQNISAVSLQDLQQNRFAGAELHGKFANISPELRYNDLNNTDLIKMLSGGDMIQAERKFHHPFKFENNAKLIFVTNELPRTADKTPAFYRRSRIIRFPNVFEGNKEDKMLKYKISRDELEGLTSKCIRILQDMMNRNFTFTNQKSTEEIADEYESLSNPIDTFIKQHCELDVDGFTTKEEFKNKLDGWLKSTRQRLRADKEVAQHMRDKGIDDQRKTISGDRKNSWVGIKWKE